MSYFPQPQTREFQRDFYDFLDALVERVPWRSEEDQKRWRQLVAELRELNVFGTMTSSITVTEEKRI